MVADEILAIIMLVGRSGKRMQTLTKARNKGAVQFDCKACVTWQMV